MSERRKRLFQPQQYKHLNFNIMHILQKLKASLRLREAVRKADEAHQQTGERYYVMPASADGCKLIIMDRSGFRKLKQKGYITHKVFVADLERECFYFTPYRNGSCAIPPEVANLKRNQYFSWCAACIRKSKNKKK